MSYEYSKIKPRLFEEANQQTFLKIRDRANELLKTAGAFRLQECALLNNSGDTWTLMACIDRLVELGELREILRDCPGQYRIFTEV